MSVFSRRHFLEAVLMAGLASSTTGSVDEALRALDKDKLVKLAIDLCDIPSPFGQEEKAARFLHDHMRANGLIARLQPFAPRRANVLGIYEGVGGGRRLMLEGHLETGGSEIVDPFPAAKLIDGEWISGIGIWNMKGALAAYVAALDAIRAADVELSGDVLIAAAAGAWDESPVETRMGTGRVQGYGIGIKHMLAHGLIADLAVVGEPTSFKLVKQHFGPALVRIDIARKSRPLPDRFTDLTGHLFEDPFDTSGTDVSVPGYAAQLIQTLNAWAFDYAHRNKIGRVPPPVGVSAIEGGRPWAPVIADQSTVFVFAGIPPRASPTSLLDELREVLARTSRKNPAIQAHAELHAVNHAPFVSDDSPVVTALCASHSDVFAHAPVDDVVQWYSMRHR